MKLFTPHYAGKMSTFSLEILLNDINLVEKLFKNNGVDIGQGYLLDSLFFAQEVGSKWVKEKEDVQSELNMDEQGRLLVVLKLIHISKELLIYKGPYLQEKLSLITKNSLDPTFGSPSNSREILFELEMLVRIRLGLDINARLRGMGSDIGFTYQGIFSQVECKYINSLNIKTVLERIEKACEQMRSLPNFYGLIALEIESQINHKKLSEAKTAQEVYRALEDEARDWFARHEKDLQDSLHCTSEVKGLLLVAHTMV